MKIEIYMAHYWKVKDAAGNLLGWIDYDPSRRYEARQARHDAHKGGISPLIGNYATLELAAAAIEASNDLLGIPSNSKTI